MAGEDRLPETSKMQRVGFVGLGYMGHGMATNIIGRGFPLSVLAHRKREAVDDLVRLGAHEVNTAAELAARSDIVILCVTGAAEVDALVRGENGLAANEHHGLIVVDCTTSDPYTLLRLADDYAGKGLSFVDAPLGRSPREAWKGDLSTMVGCDAALLETIRPVLSAFASTIQFVGVLGDGHRLKLVNNLISLGYAAIYSEALVMARKAGLSTAAYDDLMRSSRMHCSFYDTFIGWALEGDADSHQFALDAAFHTISDIVGFSQALNLRGGLASSIRDIYRHAIDAGDGNAMLPELPRSVASANGISLLPGRERSTV